MKHFVFAAAVLMTTLFFAPEYRAQSNDIPGIPSQIPLSNPGSVSTPPRTIENLTLGTHSPNELKDLEFFRKGFLKGLRLGVSGKEDVKKIFGFTCERGCIYDENWYIYFSYFEKNARLNYKYGYTVLPEYLGKIRNVWMTPRKKIPAAGLIFTEIFRVQNVPGFPLTDNKPGEMFDYYRDGYGLEYCILDFGPFKPIWDKEKFARTSGSLYSISYTIPREIEEKMFVQQKTDDK